MLKSLRLKNFKSFVDSGDVEIKSVNLLAGANSSGKSSLIQSLLLIKQTLQYGPENRPLTFNGPLLRLGAIEDVRNAISPENALEIAFELSVETSAEYGAPTWRKRSASIGRDKSAELKSFKLTVKVGREHELDSLFDTRSRLDSELISTQIDYEIEYKDYHNQILQLKIRPDEGFQTARATIDESELENIRKTYPEAEITRCYFEKFMPTVFLVDYNNTPREIMGIVDYLTGSTIFDQNHPKQDEVASAGVVRALTTWAETHDSAIKQNLEGKTLSELKVIIKHLLPFEMNLLIPRSSRAEKTRASMRDTLREALLIDMPPNFKSDGLYIDHISTIKRILQSYFKEGVRYLGPLREPPRPVYQPEALESFTDVGYRGEHTASVIEINKQTFVRYVVPPNDSDSSKLKTTSEDSLVVALTSWLKYLGVAMNVQTTDAGVYGNRLQVSTEDEGSLHDLTNVGVGVSQVLPILVSTLLAPEGSLLIFEQPELHLHPKVQSRLADFLISAARMGKQMILETHSEYLIDRLRLRIAEDEGNETASLINILFLQQKDGVTEVEPIEVTDFGVIQNWPSDFFDQSEKDSYAIIDAAQRKRQRRKQESAE